MKYLVTIESFNELVEEEIIVNVDGQELRCFTPYGIEKDINLGDKYSADIEAQFYDDIELEIIQEDIKKIECIGETFSHYIYGKVDIDKCVIKSSIEIKLDEWDLVEHGYCDNKYVRLKVDRFNLEFI
ncbi:hypothetical protein KYB31_05785 [Clostridium felsineum]|uniref:hypothetical protein n=1 Tax=Clostridium felsineum TaxID=36839 RepID=UPI00214DADFC|nr:hypothetical protein [Clostridium felsineum]MCR3758506.1 hypothetical protein [Clostridium felsineum]